MLKKLFTNLIIALPTLFILSFPVAVNAACPSGDNSPKGQVLQGVGQAGDCSGASVPNIANTVVTILSIIVGIIAVVMIIIAGLKYVTSSGDSNKIASAKSTLVYALVGVAVVVLAQFLVRYVIQHIGAAVH